MKAFLEDYPQAGVCLLYGGRERMVVNGVPCLPVAAVLKSLVPDIKLI